MEPLAAAAYVMIAAAATLAVAVGAVAGAIAWAARGRVLWIGVAAVAGYLAYMYFFESTRLEAAATIGVAPLVLALLVCWLAAYMLEARYGLRRIWTTPAGIIAALVIGALDLALFRLGLMVPTAFAGVADVFLIIAVFLLRRRFGRQ